ncbi:MAG: hypothetical protein HZA24_12660 [Nitrospirae bacterium]|nr:hypothetical protein [Nitrospirota bacterium]
MRPVAVPALFRSILTACALATPHAALAADSLGELLRDKGVVSQAELDALPQPVSTAHDGKNFTWRTADRRFDMRLYGYGQFRYTLTDAQPGTNTDGFTVQRARLGANGHAFADDLAWQLFLNVYSGKADAAVGLFDLFADYTPSTRLGVRVGQHKVPYAVQWNISAANLQFVERGAVDAAFRLDRDTGVTLHGAATPNVQYDLGVFNGEGLNRNNAGTGHLWVARLMATPLGRYALAESDQAGTAQPAVLLALGAAFNDNVASHTITSLNGRLAALGRSDVSGLNAFAGIRWRGASAQAEAHRRRIDPATSGTPAETARGLAVQAGWFVVPGKVEVAARHEHLDPDTRLSGDLVRETGVAVGRFFNGHHNKLQADLFQVTTQTAPGQDTDGVRLRVQYQVAF